MIRLSVISFIGLVILIATGGSGCGWIQTLRASIEEDEIPSAQEARGVAKNEFQRRKLPPPPTTVMDNRLGPVAGTPVDLSGTRAKTGRVTKNDFWAESLKNDNSLWSEDGQSNYLFARNKMKMPGDLVTVVVEDRLRNDMIDSVKRLLPGELRDQAVRVPGLTKEGRNVAGQAPAQPAPNADPNATAEPSHDDIITAEVLERYPNGNLRIRGVKRVPFKRRVVDIEVVSIVRGKDIDEQEQVKSSKFFEQRVEIYR